MKVDGRLLLKFIATAHRNTYAATTKVKKQHKCEVPILPKHRDYEFFEGDFSYYDSYAGSIWAPGREVVFFKRTPVWAMAYQGKSSLAHSQHFFENAVFPFLKEALRNSTDDMPFRGPVEFSDGDFQYTFEINGDYSYFTGKETITYIGEVVFSQDVMGSLIK